MSLKIITPPDTEPLTLAEAKAYLRTDEDITALIKSAREYCEDFQNKKYITQTFELILDHFPCKNEIEFLDCSPVQSVASVKYYGTDDAEYTFDSNNYIVDTDSFVARIVLGYCKTWPTTVLRPAKGVVIRFNAGYPDKMITGESLGTGDGTAQIYTLKKTPVKSVEKVYFGGVETEEYTADKTDATVRCTPEEGVAATIDYIITDISETVKQAMVLHMRLLNDDYRPDERERLERTRDTLLGMRRKVPV